MGQWSYQDLQFDEHAFSGVARLFPLPEIVLYPHVVQPLHIFEDRYRELTHDSLAEDKLIALATFAPGWEPHYSGRPKLDPIVCVGRIITHHHFEDGTYNLLVLGLRRARIVQELEPARLYRRAAVELLAEVDVPADNAAHRALRKNLVNGFKATMADSDAPPGLEELLDEAIPLGALTDLISFVLKLPAPLKQQLLAEPCAIARAEYLVKSLGAGVSAAKAFPPPFSEN